MLEKEYFIFYASAVTAIVGTVGYHMLMKKIPENVNPLISILGIYVAIVILSSLMLPFFIGSGTLLTSLKQMSWIQVGIAGCILMMEVGFLLMYRSGWNLSTGNIVTGVAINIALGFIGVVFLKEGLSALNIAGILLCITGVALIGYRGTESTTGQAVTNDAAIVEAATVSVRK